MNPTTTSPDAATLRQSTEHDLVVLKRRAWRSTLLSACAATYATLS